MVRSSLRSGRNHTLSAELSSTAGGRNRRFALVRLRSHLRIGTRRLHVLSLFIARRNVPLPFCRLFLRRGPRRHPAVAAVEAHVVVFADADPRVVHVVNVPTNVEDGAVIKEVVVLPATAYKAIAKVAKSVKRMPSIEPYFGPPQKTLVPQKTPHPPTPTTPASTGIRPQGSSPR